MKVTPHVAQNTSGRSSAIDGRTTRHVGQPIRKWIEKAFGWTKTVAGQEQITFRGRDCFGWVFTFAAAYNLTRLPRLMVAPASAPANCRLIRRWRIVEAGSWDRDHLHLSGPAIIAITNHGRATSPSARSKPVSTLNAAGLRSGFTWEGFESDDGSAEPLNDGDEAVLKAEPGTSSNPAKC